MINNKKSGVHLHFYLFVACPRLGCERNFGREGSNRKGERDDEEDDGVTFVGQPSLVFAGEPKPDGQGLYLNTILARKSVVRETGDEEERGHQRQNDPVTVRRLKTRSKQVIM